MRTLKVAVVVVVAALALSGCASLGDGKLDAPGLIEFTKEDLQAGLAIATEGGDLAAANCATALLRQLPEDGKAGLAIKGPFSGYIKGRQVLRTLDKGVDEVVHIACAPLVLDLEKRVIRLGVKLLPGGGVVGKLLGR